MDKDNLNRDFKGEVKHDSKAFDWGRFNQSRFKYVFHYTNMELGMFIPYADKFGETM
ncbi:MAG: hypothetical protein QM762_26450 [Chryseolinea sp.]